MHQIWKLVKWLLINGISPKRGQGHGRYLILYLCTCRSVRSFSQILCLWHFLLRVIALFVVLNKTFVCGVFVVPWFQGHAHFSNIFKSLNVYSSYRLRRQTYTWQLFHLVILMVLITPYLSRLYFRR